MKETIDLLIDENISAQIIIETLLKNYQDINAKQGGNQLSLLHWAFKFQRYDVVMELLGRDDIDVNTQDINGETILHYLAYQPSLLPEEPPQKLQIIKRLDPNISNKLSETPLEIILKSGQVDIKMVELILELDENFNFYSKVNDMPLLEYVIVNKIALIQFATKAVKQLNIDVLAKIIDLLSSEEKKELLLSAAKAGHKEIIEWLLNKNYVKPEEVKTYADEDNKTVLIWASYNGHIELVEYLLQQGFINVEDIKTQKAIDGSTVLLNAVLNGQIKFIEWMLEKSYITVHDVQNEKNFIGLTVLLIAACRGNIELVEWMLNKNFITSEDIKIYKTTDGITVLLCAAAYGHIEFFEWMLNKNFITSEDIKIQKSTHGFTVLLHAAENGHIEFIEWMLERRLITVQDIQSQKTFSGNTLLLRAAFNSQIRLVEWMLNKNYITVQDIKNAKNHNGDTVLLNAAYKGQIKFIEWMLERRFITINDIQSQKNSSGDTALLLAAYYGQIKFVEWMLNKNYITVQDIKTRNNGGNTTLLNAAYKGHIKFVEWMFQKKIITVKDIKTQTNYRHETALDITARIGHKEVFAFLLNEILPFETLPDRMLILHEIFNKTSHESIKSLIKEKVLQSFNEILETENETIACIDRALKLFPGIVTKEFCFKKKIECLVYFENYEQARELCFQVLNDAVYDEKIKCETRHTIIEWLLIGNYQLPDPQQLFEGLNEKFPREILKPEHIELIRRAVEAYQFVMFDEDNPFTQRFKNRLDQILSGNFSLAITEDKKIWSADIINLFENYYKAYSGIEPIRLVNLIAEKKLELMEYQSAKQIKKIHEENSVIQAENKSYRLKIAELEKLLAESKNNPEAPAKDFQRFNMFFN